MAPTDLWTEPPSRALNVGPDFDLTRFDRASTPGWQGSKKQARKALTYYARELSRLQECLYANGKTGLQRGVLLVLQGLDTAGKGGVLRHVVGMVDPQGVHIAAFGVPTKEEASHHHLWRFEKQVPSYGMIGVFDRSHYEQVLVVNVDQLEPADINVTRYEELLAFDKRIQAGGIDVIKVALMVSREEQHARLHRRLARGDKHWKYNPGDLNVHTKWDEYQEAFAQMFARTSTEDSPWHAVPADHKWYTQLAVTQLLYERLTAMNLQWPLAGFDVEAERTRLGQTFAP